MMQDIEVFDLSNAISTYLKKLSTEDSFLLNKIIDHLNSDIEPDTDTAVLTSDFATFGKQDAINYILNTFDNAISLGMPPTDPKYGNANYVESLAKEAILGSTLDSDGILVDKNILKLHVYDSNTITYPNIAVHGLGTKDSAAVLESGGPAEPEWLSKIKAAAEDPEVKNNYNWWKTIIASKYPTIIHGSANSTIKDINISSNISGDLKTIKIIDAQEKNFNRQFTDELDEKFDETLFFPSSVVIQMMGMPCINRGASIFVDMGTGTSLDNIYSVSSVTHSITPGDFTTTLNCIAPNQNIVQSTRSNYIERIKSGLKK